MTIDETYAELFRAAELCGYVGDHASDLLMQAAETIANDPITVADDNQED